jgi:hypothetical protein
MTIIARAAEFDEGTMWVSLADGGTLGVVPSAAFRFARDIGKVGGAMRQFGQVEIPQTALINALKNLTLELLRTRCPPLFEHATIQKVRDAELSLDSGRWHDKRRTFGENASVKSCIASEN